MRQRLSKTTMRLSESFCLVEPWLASLPDKGDTRSHTPKGSTLRFRRFAELLRDTLTKHIYHDVGLSWRGAIRGHQDDYVAYRSSQNTASSHLFTYLYTYAC